MAKKFNLADFAQPVIKPMSESDKPEITMLPITEIRPNKSNFYDCGNYIDLAESISVNGLLQPITVYKSDFGYVILSGHRRFKALRYLHDADGSAGTWNTVPCLIADAPSSSAHEMLILCQANSTSRVLSNWEIAQQSRIIRESLVEISKENGIELPERMRATVAEALKISESKLARIEAIDKHLTVQSFVDGFKRGTLPEEAAYKLSQLTPEQQEQTEELMKSSGTEPSRASIKDVKLARLVLESNNKPSEIEYDFLAETKADHAAVEAAMSSLMHGINFGSIYTRRDGAEALKAKHGRGCCGFSAGKYTIDFSPKGMRYVGNGTSRLMPWTDVWDCMGDIARAELRDRRIVDSASAGLPPTLPRWIKCSDQSPAENQLVILYWPQNGTTDIAMFEACWLADNDDEVLTYVTIDTHDVLDDDGAYWLPAPSEVPKK